MNREEKFRSYREQLADTKLIDILELQDKKTDLLLKRVEYLIEMVERQSSSLYELSKQPTEIFELTPFNALPKDELDKAIVFDEMFKESLKEYDNLLKDMDCSLTLEEVKAFGVEK